MTSTNKIEIVTFCNKVDNRIQPLIDSCNSNNLTLHILGEGIEWTSNLLMIKLLNKFLIDVKKTNTVYLIVDAFDVIINTSSEEILNKFNSFNSEIVFAAEYNFYIGIVKWREELYKKYPKSSTIFQYLNAGTFIGYANSLLQLTNDVIKDYQIKFNDLEFLKSHNSEQSFYSKYYVDNYSKIKKDSFNFLQLDFNQELMYCSGGRRAVINWKFNNTLKSNIFSKVERKYIRKKKLNIYQNKFTDLEYDKNNKEFICTTTNTTPNVIHIPGCKGNEFEKLLNTIYSAKQMTNIKAIYYSIKSRVKTEFIFRSPERSFKILRKA